MKAMIHKELERMNGIFQKYGIETEGFPDPAPSSLTALLLRDREIAFFLIPNIAAWSLGHVLSAAKLLSSRGGRSPVIGCKYARMAASLSGPKGAADRPQLPLTMVVSP